MLVSLHEGAIFAGRYRVVRLIASGGMGAVYEVVHRGTQRRRALKVMLPHVLQNEELRERFKREAKVAADVDSEFIVDVFDAGVDDATGMPFLVMELLRGEELGKRLKRLGPLPPAEAVTYLHQVALALDKTHRASIVHRDLKPDNIFLTMREEGPPRVKILDFGVAKLVAEGATNAGATEVVGTPTYMAPEQFHGDGPVTPAADIYSLGLMAFTCLVGVPYWKDEASSGNAFAVAMVAARGTAERASVRAARRGITLPLSFDAWFAIATAVDPRQRFPTATAATRALAEMLGIPVFTATGEYPMVRPDIPDPAAGAPQIQSTRLPSMALPAVSATLSQPREARRTGVTLVGLALGSLIGIIAGVWAYQQRSRPLDTTSASASPSDTAAPSKPPVAPASPANPAPPRAASASAAPPPDPAPTASASASARATADAQAPNPAPSSSVIKAPWPKAAKTASPSKPGPVYSQE